VLSACKRGHHEHVALVPQTHRARAARRVFEGFLQNRQLPGVNTAGAASSRGKATRPESSPEYDRGDKAGHRDSWGFGYIVTRGPCYDYDATDHQVLIGQHIVEETAKVLPLLQHLSALPQTLRENIRGPRRWASPAILWRCQAATA
jgi:hypothetical protein